MTRKTATIHRLPVRARLVCKACGAAGEGSCGCGADYVPAGERAAEAVAANPAKSDRAIAEEIGVSHPTVAKARKAATGKSLPVDKRTGRDGKARKLPTRAEREPVPASDDMPASDDIPPTPAEAKRAARANAKLASLAVRDQVNAFTGELIKFEDDFSLRLVSWLDATAVDADGRAALVLFLSQCSMRLQKLAQKIDGR